MSSRVRSLLLALAAGAFAVLCALGAISVAVAGVWVLVALLAATLVRNPRASVRILLVLAAVALGVVAVELGLRAAGHHPVHFRPHDVLLRRWPEDPRLQRYAPRRELEMDSHGDLAALSGRRDLAVPRRLRFSTDEHGFRVTEGANEPARVIVLGDSFGCGVGTSQEDTLASLLATRYGHAVANLSVGGHDARQEWLTLLHEARRLQLGAQHTVLWLLFPTNDLEGTLAALGEWATPRVRDRPRPLVPLPPPPGRATVAWRRYLAWRRRSPAGFVLDRLRHPDPGRTLTDRIAVASLPDGAPLLFYRPYADRAALSRAQVREHPGGAALERTFAAAAQLSRRRGFRVLVALLPSKTEIYGWALHGAPPFSTPPPSAGLAALASELAEAQGLPTLDLAPILREAAEDAYEEGGALLWWRDDTHLNARGHAVVAAALDDWLRAEPTESETSTGSGR